MEYFQELSEQLKENGVNPADFLNSFNDILKKNDVSITDMGKAALLQKAAAAAGIDASAFSVLLGTCSSHVFTNPDFSICLFCSAHAKKQFYEVRILVYLLFEYFYQIYRVSHRLVPTFDYNS